MKILRAVLSRGKEDYGAWMDNLDGVYGAGDTVADAKKNLLEGLALYIKHNRNIPAWLKNKQYKIVYQFDAESILSYYKGILTNAGLERMTGINQRLIQQYATGTKKPRQLQLKKIESALHKLGHELIEVQL